jgi:hypothetical protein
MRKIINDGEVEVDLTDDFEELVLIICLLYGTWKVGRHESDQYQWERYLKMFKSKFRPNRNYIIKR